MTTVTIELRESAAPSCAAKACDRVGRRWDVTMRVVARDAHAFAAAPPIGRNFTACDVHALPVAQYLLGEVLISDTLRTASGMQPRW